MKYDNPMNHLTRPRLPATLTSLAALLAAISLNGQTWDGGGFPDANTGTDTNWVDSNLPTSSGADVIFAGSTNTNVNNNYFTQLNDLAFAAGAASFVISGNSLDPFPVQPSATDYSISNSSVNLQTIALNFTTSGSSTSYVGIGGIAGSHTHFSGDIGGNGSVSFLRTSGSSNPVFELSGNNSFQIVRMTNATLWLSSESAAPTTQINLNNNSARFDNTSGSTINATADVRLAGHAGYLGTDDFITAGDLIITYNNDIRNFSIDGSTVSVGRLSKQGAADGRFTKLGAGTLEVANAAAADLLGDFRATAGTVRFGHQNALGYGNWILGSATFTPTSNLSGANAVTNTIELDGNAIIAGSNNLTLAGDIVNATTPGDSITINSSATIEFAGENSYSGATLVQAGTLLINGNQAAATGAVTVASGAILGGSGTIGGATTISGSLRPGNSIGTLSIANDVTWNSGQDWVFELGAGNSSDRLAITDGALLKGSGDVFQFDFDGSTETGVFTLLSWTSEASLGGDALGTDFMLDDFSYTNLGGGLTGTFAFDDTSLQFTVIPEPGIAALLTGTLGLLITLRRRRIG